jgi:replicative DNA helicase
MAAFQFEPGFQRAVLRLMMVDDVFCLRALQHCRASFFTTEPLGWIFNVLAEYWKTYRMTCGDVPLRGALRYVRQDKVALYYAEIEAVIAAGNVAESDYVKHELGNFCRRNLFSQAHQESARLFNAGKADEAYDMMAATQDEIRKVDFGTVDRQWFFEELDDRQRERYQRTMEKHAFATGITDLDFVTEGGVQRGEVWAVLAYAKRCKTTWLTNQGFNAVRMYAEPVLHVILEGQGHQIAAKYDALFSNQLYTAVKRGEIDPQAYAAMQQEYMRMRELLVIRTLNDWDVNILQVKAELDELKSHAFRPGLLILDYVDLLRSRYRADSETKHQVEASRDLKRLVNTEEVACWTAWQAQRPKENAHQREHVLTSGNVADAYAKVRIVDSYGSLNATDDEMKKGEMRVFWEGHRDAPVNKTWVITNDLSRQRMVTSILADSDQPAAEAPN